MKMKILLEIKYSEEDDTLCEEYCRFLDHPNGSICRPECNIFGRLAAQKIKATGVIINGILTQKYYRHPECIRAENDLDDALQDEHRDKKLRS